MSLGFPTNTSSQPAFSFGQTSPAGNMTTPYQNLVNAGAAYTHSGSMLTTADTRLDNIRFISSGRVSSTTPTSGSNAPMSSQFSSFPTSSTPFGQTIQSQNDVVDLSLNMMSTAPATQPSTLAGGQFMGTLGNGSNSQIPEASKMAHSFLRGVPRQGIVAALPVTDFARVMALYNVPAPAAPAPTPTTGGTLFTQTTQATPAPATSSLFAQTMPAVPPQSVTTPIYNLSTVPQAAMARAQGSIPAPTPVSAPSYVVLTPGKYLKGVPRAPTQFPQPSTLSEDFNKVWGIYNVPAVATPSNLPPLPVSATPIVTPVQQSPFSSLAAAQTTTPFSNVGPATSQTTTPFSVATAPAPATQSVTTPFSVAQPVVAPPVVNPANVTRGMALKGVPNVQQNLTIGQAVPVNAESVRIAQIYGLQLR